MMSRWGRRRGVVASDAASQRAAVAARVASQRERHTARPFVVRIVVVLAGGLAALAGLLLVIPLPEGGIPLLLLALRLLALEYDWAARGYAGASWRWERFKQRWRSWPAWLRYGTVVAITALVIALVWWLLA
ncbi:MAG: hypothetical protein ACRDT5_00640 [Mycobacterium sp.]